MIEKAPVSIYPTPLEATRGCEEFIVLPDDDDDVGLVVFVVVLDEERNDDSNGEMANSIVFVETTMGDNSSTGATEDGVVDEMADGVTDGAAEVEGG